MVKREEHQATCLWDPMPHQAHDPKREQGGIGPCLPWRDYAVRQSFLGAFCCTHTTHTHIHTLLESAAWNSEKGQTGSGDMGKLVLSKALQLPAQFQSPLFFDAPQSWVEQGWTRKGIKFWVESLITDSAGELSFRAQFRLPPICIHVFSCFLHLGTPFAPPHSRRAWF